MNTAKQAAWLLMTLIILGWSGWYFTHLKPVIRLDKDTLSSTVDTSISRLTVAKFDTQGKMINLLTTPLMEHIPKDDVNFFKTPHIIIVQDNQPPWDIRSQSAKSIAGGDRIVFQKQVIVHQDGDEKTQESTLKTEEVTYFPKEKRATSDVLVTYEQPGNFVQSIGMNAYLDEKRVELLHQARGSYAPAKG